MTDGNIDIDPSQTGCLPLSGGTITGHLMLKQEVAELSPSEGDSFIRVKGDRDINNGSFLELHSTASPYSGVFSLKAGKNSDGNRYELNGGPSGFLVWGGRNIPLSVNGQAADESGSIVLSPENVGCLPLSGGRMTGGISFLDSGYVEVANTDSYKYISWHGMDQGGEFIAFSQHSAKGGRSFICRCRGPNGEMYDLKGGSDDTLTWNGNEIERVESYGGNYTRFMSGLQLCWGYGTANVGDITFAVPFVDTNYMVVSSVNGTYVNSGICSSSEKVSTSAFKIHGVGNYGMFWIAIGRWK